MKYIVTTEEQLKRLGLAWKKLGKLSIQDDDDKFMTAQEHVESVFLETIKVELPDWATHVADIRTASEDSISKVKLIQFVPIDMLKDLPAEMRRSSNSALAN